MRSWMRLVFLRGYLPFPWTEKNYNGLKFPQMKLNRFFAMVIFLLVFIANVNAQSSAEVTVLQEQYQVPLLKGKSSNPFIRLKLVVSGNKGVAVNGFQFSLKGTTSLQDIEQLSLYYLSFFTFHFTRKIGRHQERIGNIRMLAFFQVT
jgi:hypothetical protein